ncbi:MAG: prepilin-type N-terminal cleavage/methylation domain-containing protein [Planctomycetes bacterium]|nr:prepilin-type N-terminal cleavage/methylation domain-containing protein [Planctomycetota bacterium]
MSIKPKHGFTLIELLIVIAIIAILVGFTVVVAGGMMNRAKSTKDMANHRIIGTATWSHSVDNKGSLLHPRIYAHIWGPEPQDNSTQEQIQRMWIAADGQDANGYDRTVLFEGQQVELQSALKDGAAYPYIGDLMVYQSPLDPTVGDVNDFTGGNANISAKRIRSYSLNGFIGVEWGADDYVGFRDDEMQLQENGYWHATETVSQIPQPSNTMCSIGEDDKNGRNLNGWILNPDSTIETWHDYPAFWDETGVNISYIDGSTGFIELSSDSLKQSWENDGHDGTTDGLKEYRAFRKVLLPGRIGTILDM